MTITSPPVAIPLVDRLADHRALVPLRIGVGPLVAVQLWPVIVAAGAGVVPGEVFTKPYLPFYPVPPPGLLVSVLVAAMTAAVATSIGLFTRSAAATTAVLYAWWLFSSDLHYHHNRGLLLLLIALIAVTRSGGSFSIDALRTRGRDREATTVGWLWPLLLMRFELALMYLVSGGSKLLDPDWVGGTVTWLRVSQALGPGPRPWFVAVAADPAFHRFLAPAVVLTELFIGAGLLTRRFRTAAIWLAIPFHLAIELTAQVQTFSYAALLALVVWVTPTTRRHLLTLPDGDRRLRWAVRRLDWTGRLAMAREAGEATLRSPDGTIRAGADAGAGALALLPLAFWPVTTWSAVRTIAAGARGRRRREGVAGGA